MRTIIAVACALCISSSSRADTPPAEAPAAHAPVAAPAPPAASSSAPAVAPATPPPADPFLVDPTSPRATHSRVPEIVATIVTGGLVVATGASYWKWGQAQGVQRAAQWDPDVTIEEYERAIDDGERWKKRTWVLIGSTFVSAAVTAFTWMRHQDPSSFSVQPTGDGEGAAVSYGGRF